MEISENWVTELQQRRLALQGAPEQMRSGEVRAWKEELIEIFVKCLEATNDPDQLTTVHLLVESLLRGKIKIDLNY